MIIFWGCCGSNICIEKRDGNLRCFWLENPETLSSASRVGRWTLQQEAPFDLHFTEITRLINNSCTRCEWDGEWDREKKINRLFYISRLMERIQTHSRACSHCRALITFWLSIGNTRSSRSFGCYTYWFIWMKRKHVERRNDLSGIS